MRFYYIKKLPGFTALFCLLWAVLIQSCKKTDNDVVIKDELTTTTPYSLTGKDNKQVARVFKELNKRGLTNEAFTRYGKLLWDKSIVLPYAHSQSPAYNTRAHNGIDSVVITPIVPENTKEVTAYLQAWIGDTVSLAIYTKHQYTALAFGNTLNNGIGEAEKLALQFMHLNKLVFNYTTFQITDKRLFAGDLPVLDTAKAGVLIRLKEPENNISSRLRYVELCVDIIRTSCTTPTAPQCMPTCDNCPGYCQTTETICTGWWEDDNPGGGEGPALPDPGDGSGGGTNLPGSGDPCGGGRIMGARLPPCGGGGGGTGGGSGGGWIPIVPDEPYVCNYVMTEQQQNVFNQIDEEDSQADYEHQNFDCKGTKRSGNYFFYGTTQHWIIQLDYVSRESLNGEAEFKIPYASTNNPTQSGYVDIANLHNGNMLEIKPNTPTGIASGSTEITNYVSKANQHCTSTLPTGTIWNKASVYPTRYLPFGTNKYLKVELNSPGLIVYSEIIRPDPPPVPVVVPASVVEKFKHLIDRLKNNFNQADKIIAEYMQQNPDLVTYIKTAAIGAGIAIIVGTIIEDILTAGTGIADDWACFTLAYRIIRFAVKL